MTTPRVLQLTAIPVAWTPATKGTVTAPIVVAPMKRERDFAAWHGKLSGKIVLIDLPTDGSELTEAPFKRLTSEDISKMDKYPSPDIDPARLDKTLKRVGFSAKLDAFLKTEGALVAVKESYRDGKLVHGEGYHHDVGDTPALSSEPYSWPNRPR